MRKSLGKKQKTKEFSQSFIVSIWKEKCQEFCAFPFKWESKKEQIRYKNKNNINPNYCHMFGYTYMYFEATVTGFYKKKFYKQVYFLKQAADMPYN